MRSLIEPWLRQLANSGLERTIPCRLATTQREFDAVAALRYTVHVREQNVPLADADHRSRSIWYPDDELPGTLHFYAGTPEKMLGCLRVRVWRPGEVPADLHEFYSLDRLPGAERTTLCDVSKMVVIPELRGKAAMAALSGYSVYETVARHGNQAMVACCAPGLLRSYRAIGLRTFGGRLRHTAWGLIIPLVGITADVEHVYRIGSPWYPALRRLKKEGRLPADLPEVRAAAESDRGALTERRDVAPEVEAFVRTGASAFLQALPPAAIDALGRYGMILNVTPGVCLVRDGIAESEVFVVLDGEVAAWRHDRELRRMKRGEVFGEIAILSDSGQRRAEVRAVTPCRVLVLRRRMFAELSKNEPTTALAIYRALTQELLAKLDRIADFAPARAVGGAVEST